MLCPSFYRADIIHNPTRGDLLLARVRTTVITWLQRRRESQRVTFA
jgi:indolepyruvate ferredoxin oxidoreductase alpha subunit